MLNANCLCILFQEYISNKNKKTQKRREQIGDETILKKQLTQQHDVLQGTQETNSFLYLFNFI